MIVFVWIFAILCLIMVLISIVVFELLQKAWQENVSLTIKANAPRVIESSDDVICYMRLADGTNYEVRLKDIAIGGKSNA